MGLQFDRRVSGELLHEILPGGQFGGLVRLREEWAERADLQLRAARAADCHASLYIGMTSVIDVYERQGKFALRAHSTHRQAGGFDPAWMLYRPIEDWTGQWPAVETYLRRLVDGGRVDPRWYLREGVVQTAVSTGSHSSYGAFQREAVVWSDGTPSATQLASRISDRIWQAVGSGGRSDRWWPGVRARGVRPGMGDEVDVLALDDRGRLLCVEVKPAGSTHGIAWAAAQVLLYAELFAMWADEDPTAAASSISGMSAQRVKLGLLDPRWAQSSRSAERVVPVVAIGEGLSSRHALPRLGQIWQALSGMQLHDRLDPLEVWILDVQGEVTEVWVPEMGGPPPGAVSVPRNDIVVGPAPADGQEATTERDVVEVRYWKPNSFEDRARVQAVSWKATTPLLPELARQPGRYEDRPGLLDYVLPDEYRYLNLLPEARDIAESRFAAAGIRWHGDGRGPNPHLLSSQVQCLNALAPLVARPDQLAAWLSTRLPVAEVIPFGADTASPFDRDDHVVFEWQGLVDHLGEWRGQLPTRGAMATSVDAAVRYRTREGKVELALIEWKYTESYPYGGRLDGPAASHARRLARYRTMVDDPEGPVRLAGGVDYEDLFAEPTYQLMRLQLLAWKLERAGELGISRAVVVYAAPHANLALLQGSLGAHRFERFALENGGLVPAWTALLRRADRFVVLDTAELASASGVTSDNFKVRYANLTEEAAPSGTSDASLGADVATGVLPDRMTGEQLQELAFDGDVDHIYVGRQGGLTGVRLEEDLRTGRWRQWAYRVTSGTAAPNGNWFRLEELLDRVARYRSEKRERAGWSVIGKVAVDSSSVAVAVPSAARRLSVSDQLDRLDGMAVLVTRVDCDLPIETRAVDGRMIEVRADVVDDVNDLEGQWKRLTLLDVGDDGVVWFDPYRSLDGRVVSVQPGPGRWEVSVFNSGGDDLALRMLRT